MTDERRKYPRKSVSMEVRWEGMAGKYMARVSDISLGGCFIDTIGKAETGEHLSFSILTPRGEWLALQGYVVAYDPNVGFSVIYEALTPKQRDAVEILFNSLP